MLGKIHFTNVLNNDVSLNQSLNSVIDWLTGQIFRNCGLDVNPL